MGRTSAYGFLLLLCLLAIPALAQVAAPSVAEGLAAPIPEPAPAEPIPLPVNSLSIIAGFFTTSFWARSFGINEVGYEPNFVLGLISGRDILTTSWGLRIGHESGIALRFGADFSIETWRAITISFGARRLGSIVLFPKLALGISSTTNPIGVEVGREAAVENGDMDRLIYNGVEIAQYIETLPFVQVFYRLHHRSGALGFWGNVPDGHNANSVGITFRY